MLKEGAVRESRYLAALQLTLSARERLLKAMRLCKVTESAAELARQISGYLVGRVGGRWRVVDRREGGAFDDAAVEGTYAGFFDAPPPSR